MTNSNPKPVPGQVYLCKIMNFHTKNVQEHLMKCVDEDECQWRTADDNSELDEWNWQVVTFKAVQNNDIRTK